MSEIPKAYEPQAVEDKWYQFWLDQKCFVADPSSAKPAYSIVIPPPNITGMLHMGHVLNNTIQDILARKARMDGKEVLWLPGTDHAGIATQVMLEKHLKKEEKKTRHDVGREEFLKRVWAWKDKHGDIITQQLKKLGCSCDWTRERFTMDPDYSRCVQKVFVELYRKGLIYRGKRMVNWCPATQTALSDEEVVMKEQNGFLYYFKVEVAELPGTFLTIATTRPETIPGDTAVAVNPKDPRYTHLIGKHIVRPLPNELTREQKLIRIIGDDHVEFEFGTGVLKVTPAHDSTDYDIALRAAKRESDRRFLDFPEVIDTRGIMTRDAGNDLVGLDRFKARKVAVEKLAEIGALEKSEPYKNSVGFSERADVPIEPRLSEQWFLKYPSVDQARGCVEQDQEGSARVSRADSGAPPESPSREGKPVGETPTGAGGTPALPRKMRFHPQRWAKVYDHWLANIQDWCISRQLWWGHRIPVWKNWLSAEHINEFPAHLQVLLTHENLAVGFEFSLSGDPQNSTFFRFSSVDRRPTSFRNNAPEFTAATNSPLEAAELERLHFDQDPDVLDTWFSSWLWPFATMGWPEQTATLKKFYPTTDLVTGPDIIFFWVARMIMAGYEFMGDLPFHDVYFTGIIRDKQGRKMSKTLGNSPDPLVLIGNYGADALRFGTMRSAPLGQDVLFDQKDVELGRNFCNKLWNACRFRQMQHGDVQGEISPGLLTSDDKWILIKLDQAIREITAALSDYRFNEATSALYRFFWSEYCDWYVEASKATLSRPVDPINRETVETAPDSRIQGFKDSTARQANTLAVIDFVLSHTLRLFHPFLPFITEELWHGMGYAEDMPDNQGGKSILFAPWPKPFDNDEKAHYGLSPEAEQEVSARYSFIADIRNLRAEKGISSNKRIRVIYRHVDRGLSDSDWGVVRQLAGVETVDFIPDYQPASGEPVVHPPFGGKLFMPLAGLIDTAAEKARLTKELEKIEAEIARAEQKLANPNFTQKAPPEVLAEHKKRLAEWQTKRAHARSALGALG